MGNRLREIKSILKSPQKPKLGYERKIPIRLTSCNPSIITLKELYSPHFQPIKLDLTHKRVTDVPAWITALSETLSLYLDVFIVRNKVMVENYVNPVYTLSIIGEERQAFLAAHYIEYIHNSIELSVEASRERHKQKARSHRRRGRRGNSDKVLLDTRVFSRNFRHKNVSIINNTINRLLEEIKNTNEYAFNKGVDRQERINHYLARKYSDKWKKVLFKQGG